MHSTSPALLPLSPEWHVRIFFNILTIAIRMFWARTLMGILTMSMSLFLRNLFFTILQPGVVAGLIPFLLARKNFENAFAGAFHVHHYAGILVCIAGIMTTLHCIANFAIRGRGTLSPADPTQRLVISGLYKFSRNPMYVGVMLTLVGEAIFAQSVSLFVYSLGVFTAFHLFIVFREEPRLKKDFGTSYQEYCKTVRRWI